MAGQHDLLELSRHLKQERLFINSEREQLQSLHGHVSKSAENLYHLSWVTRRQKTNLDLLILGNKEMTPLVCCQQSNCLERVNFIDGYKILSYHEGKIGEFLKNLRENPKLVASCLLHAEKIGVDIMQQIAHITVSGLYGNSVMHEDESFLMLVLKSLIEQQLAKSDNPRRMLRKGSCTFSVIFKLLNEGMYSAKLFLTAALHQPVMQLLMEDEWFYDIDPDRALYRFPPAQRQSRFGELGTDKYETKTKQYRELTTDKLVALAGCFISNLKQNMHCFPQNLAWIISQMYHTLCQSDNISTTEAKAICADLVFVSFICPAICDPEPFGITSDVPISYIARHNLMQLAQILQVLAIREWEDTDAKSRDLYDKFPQGCMSFLLDTLLDTPCSEQVPQSNNQLSAFNRAAVLLTHTELLQLITFLHELLNNLDPNDPIHKTLTSLTEHVATPTVLRSLQPQLSGTRERFLSTSPAHTPQPTPPGTPSSSKKLSKSKDKKKGHFLTPDTSINQDEAEEGEESKVKVQEDVLVISLGVVNECPGMQSEQKVLEQEGRHKKAKYNSLLPGEDDPVSESEINLHEKRTRFSLSHDQDSIATSDNLEAISEAASSHSVGSDLDDNENDNLSDMVSANVSGRGTPNISGRDTPVSQAESQAEGAEERRAPDLPVIVQKTNREDVTDRFGKFDIKQELERDDIKSTVSDTWSTDVLASDSEPPEQNQLERLEEVAEEVLRHNLLGVQEVCEISETASDAWSTDVLASDTSERQSERLLELEQDDTGSVSSRGQPPDENESTTDPPESHEGTPQPQENMGNAAASEHFHSLDGASAAGIQATGGKSTSESDCPPHQFLPVFDSQQLGMFKKSVKKTDSGTDNVLRSKMFDGGSGDKGSTRKLCVSEYVTSFNKLPDRTVATDKRRSDSLRYAQGRVNAVLQSLENGSTDRRTGDLDLPSHENGNLLDSGSVQSNLASSVQTLVSESSVLSPASNVTTPPAGEDITPFRQESSASSPGASLDDSASMSDSFQADNNGVKLSEQQNTNIDANRLSATLSLFDPLMQNEGHRAAETTGIGDNLSGEGFRKVTSNSNTTSTVTSAYSRASYNEMGARPKIPLSDHSPPKISLKLNSLSLDISEDTPDRPLPTSDRPLPAPDRPLPSTDRPLSSSDRHLPGGRGSSSFEEQKQRVSLSSDADNCDTDSSSVHSNASIGALNKDAMLNNPAMKRHSSTLSESSSTSSLVDIVSGTASAAAGQGMGRDKTDVVIPMGPAASSTPTRRHEDHKELEDRNKESSRRKGGFLTAFKEKLSKGGKRKGKTSEKDETAAREISGIRPLSAPMDQTDDVFDSKPRPTSSSSRSSEDQGPTNNASMETTDDILAKYRNHIPSTTLKPLDNSPVTSNNKMRDKENPKPQEEDDTTSTPAYDPNNLETCKAFIDAKKKLRLVLSTADFMTMSSIPGSSSCFMRVAGAGGGLSGGGERKDNDLVAFLKVQLAEAINLQDRDLIAQLHETIRCLRQFDNIETRKLLKTMRDEYRGRAPYVAYLVRSRQGLLSTEAHLERMLERVARDKAVVNKYFLSVFVRLFLEKRQRSLEKFIAYFQKLSVSDEKTEHVERYLAETYHRIEEDPEWQAASGSQREEARLYIERSIMNHIYTYAMYPNGDGDMLRDQILHDHMSKLSAIISPSHKDLSIPAVYHYECPWPAAQREIFMINAYKTPKDKLNCVLRCSATIMNLLRMANEKSVPAADDFMPVLIFVLIKANPPSLLSTVQYVNNFYCKRLYGEEQYWWMQFSSGVEFIKTMDYGPQ